MSTDASTSKLRGSNRELWFNEPRHVEVRHVPLPFPAPRQLLVRALCSGISQGTELLLYRGEGPTPFDPSLDAPGQPTYPRRYGYAWVGEVVAGVDDGTGSVATIPVGTRVFALAPHAEYHVLEADALTIIDASIPPERAVLTANLETALTGVWDARISLGDEVVILGGGIVGLLTAWLARLSGAHVRLVEPAARRREAARRLGISQAVTPENDVPLGATDVVIEATGDPSNLKQAILHAGPEACITILSFYGERVAPVPLGIEFHRRRLSLRASQVSSVPPSRRARWSNARRLQLVQTLLAESVLDELLDPPVPFEQAPSVYAGLEQASGGALQMVFRYDG